MKTSEELTGAIDSVLTRITMPPGQITLIKALREDRDGCVSLPDLAHLIRNDDQDSMIKVLGAFGNRINRTDAFKVSKPGIRAVLEVQKIEGVPHYSLRPEARKAIEGLPALIAAMQLSVSTIHKRWPNGGKQGLDCVRREAD